MLMIHKTFSKYDHDCTQDFDTQFRPVPEGLPYDTYFVDPHYGLDPNGLKHFMIETVWSINTALLKRATKLRLLL